MTIVQYFEIDGAKKFDIAQALRDSGWGVTHTRIDEMEGCRLVDRGNPAITATVSRVRADSFFGMIFIEYEEGGWQCLDHAIEQFEIDDMCVGAAQVT